jgi:hypothetical protein
MGEPRQAYKLENPEAWREFRARFREFSTLYETEVAELKAYQASSEGQTEAENF